MVQLVRELTAGTKIDQDLICDGKVLIKGGSIITSSQVQLILRWFKKSDARINVTTNDNAPNVNISDCIDPKLNEQLILGIKSLNEATLEQFGDAYRKVETYIPEAISRLKSATVMGCNSDDYTKSGPGLRDPHTIRSFKLTVALAHRYNSTVPNREEIDLGTIGSASLIHDYGKRFQGHMDELKNCKPNKEFVKTFKLHPSFHKNSFVFELHPFYAYMALDGKVPDDVREIVLLSGLPNRKLDELDTYSPKVKAAQIISMCHLYDKLLEMTFQQDISIENCLSTIEQHVEEGKINRSIYNLFMQHVIIYPIKTQVLLSTGEHATVISNVPNYPARPIVLTDNSKGTPQVINLSQVTTVTAQQIVSSQMATSEQVKNFMDTQLGNMVTLE